MDFKTRLQITKKWIFDDRFHSVTWFIDGTHTPTTGESYGKKRWWSFKLKDSTWNILVIVNYNYNILIINRPLY